MKKEDKIIKIIKESGNTFHYEVVKFLRDKGWTVLVSPYYSDYASDKSREVDLIAEKGFVVRYTNPPSTLNIKLFIECKYINKEVVFWFDKRDEFRSAQLVLNSTPLKSIGEENHHYLKYKEVAKLYAPGKNNNEDIIYKAITQSLNSLIYYKLNGNSIIPKKDSVLRFINYPLIVCNNFDNFYTAGDRNRYSKITENFQLEVNYAYRRITDGININEYFLIDVIDFDKLDEFIDNIEKNEVVSMALAVQ